MKYDLVIFDLDGTLLDTLGDLAAAANMALAEFGFPSRDVEYVRRFIGGGVGRLIRLAVPEGTDAGITQACIDRFRVLYAENLNVRTAPFADIPELLSQLRGRGLHVAVNSNKLDSASNALCLAHFGDAIELTLGERAEIPRKPAPDGARFIMRHFGVEPARTLYVGDGDTDIQTAANAGIDGVWVTWGYRRREELAGLTLPHTFETVEALRDFILSD